MTLKGMIDTKKICVNLWFLRKSASLFLYFPLSYPRQIASSASAHSAARTASILSLYR